MMIGTNGMIMMKGLQMNELDKQKNHAPRDNQKQNEQVDRIVKDLGLSKAERRLLHDEITDNVGYRKYWKSQKNLGRR